MPKYTNGTVPKAKVVFRCACGWSGDLSQLEGGTGVVNYFCPACGTGRYLYEDRVIIEEGKE